MNQNDTSSMYVLRKIAYVKLLNKNYSVKYDYVNKYNKLLNQICIYVPTIIPELCVGDTVSIEVAHTQEHICNGDVEKGLKVFDDGKCELMFINREHLDNGPDEYTYIFYQCKRTDVN